MLEHPLYYTCIYVYIRSRPKQFEATCWSPEAPTLLVHFWPSADPKISQESSEAKSGERIVEWDGPSLSCYWKNWRNRLAYKEGTSPLACERRRRLSWRITRYASRGWLSPFSFWRVHPWGSWAILGLVLDHGCEQKRHSLIFTADIGVDN